MLETEGAEDQKGPGGPGMGKKFNWALLAWSIENAGQLDTPLPKYKAAYRPIVVTLLGSHSEGLSATGLANSNRPTD